MMSQKSKDIKLKLNNIYEIKDIYNLLSKIDFEAYFVSGRYFLDAKSLMSIFTMDLTKELTLRIYFLPEQKEAVTKFIKDIGTFTL